MTKEIYISFDIESDGPCPGVHSMLSLAAVAIDPQLPAPEISSFSVNFELLPGATRDPGTTAFWAEHSHAYDATRINQQPPEKAMRAFAAWIRALPYKKVALAYPAGFDFTFIYWYGHTFLGESPLGFSALDIKTYGACLLNEPYSDATKRNFPDEWFDRSKPHTHIALDDAREQGHLFCKMFEARQELERTQQRYRDDAINDAILRLQELRGRA